MALSHLNGGSTLENVIKGHSGRNIASIRMIDWLEDPHQDDDEYCAPAFLEDFESEVYDDA